MNDEQQKLPLAENPIDEEATTIPLKRVSKSASAEPDEELPPPRPAQTTPLPGPANPPPTYIARGSTDANSLLEDLFPHQFGAGKAAGKAGATSFGEGDLAAAETQLADSNELEEENAKELRRSAGTLLTSGSLIGRLEIKETLGEGAFGLVVAAFDPQLKRKLAIKILRPEVFDSAGGATAQQRLMREARAMAKVSHPNVVTVHDIGTINGQIFVAMEFVEGKNLREWLKAESPSVDEILDVFCQAGQGLSAAHRANLVHRDFKPDNVLVGRGGRVRVADFGLVSIRGGGEDRVSSDQIPTARVASDELLLTGAGAVMGTALYMSPEQHNGKVARAASDQFSFCVALYEALYGCQPFPGTNYPELRKNVLKSQLTPPPSKPRVSSKVQKALLRGLSTDEDDRFPSMDALVHALRPSPGAGKSRWPLAAAALLVVGMAAGSYVFIRSNENSSLCKNSRQQLAGIWDGSERERLSRLFTQSGRSGGFAHYASALDGYTDSWVRIRTKVCEATHIHGEQSGSLLDQRMLCLDQRLSYLNTLNAQLQEGISAETLDKAVRAANALPSFEHCTNRQSLLSQEPLPDDPDDRKRAINMGQMGDQAEALQQLGSIDEAQEILETALEIPTTHTATLARLEKGLGSILLDKGQKESGEERIRSAIDHATRAGNDMLVANSWLALMHLSGVENEDYDKGYEYGEMARLSLMRGHASPLDLALLDKATATIKRREGKSEEALSLVQSALPAFEAEATPLQLSSLHTLQADILVDQAKYDEAIASYQESLGLIAKSVGPLHPDNLYVLNNMAVAQKGAGDIDGAQTSLETSIDTIVASYGEESHLLVTAYNNLGNVLRRKGDLETAAQRFNDAIRIGTQSLEADHPTVTKAMMNLAIVKATAKDYAAATDAFRVVLERTEASFDGDHPDRAMALNNMGESLSLEEKYEEALPYLLEAKEMKARLHGPTHPKSASTLFTLGTVYGHLDRLSEASHYIESARSIFVEAAGPDHPRSIAATSALGRLRLREGKLDQAKALLEESLERRAATKPDPKEDALDRFALLRVLGASKPSEAAAQAEALRQQLADAERELELQVELRAFAADPSGYREPAAAGGGADGSSRGKPSSSTLRPMNKRNAIRRRP